MTDPFGCAIRDHYLGNQEEPLIDRDGEEIREHSIKEWYFEKHDDDAWRDAWMNGPLIDLGAGVGRDVLYYQNQFETSGYSSGYSDGGGSYKGTNDGDQSYHEDNDRDNDGKYDED